MRTKKRAVLIAVAVLLLLIAGIIWNVVAKNSESCAEREMSGECLPEGKCVAPNDAIVSCEKLRQNPNKTDWFGNE